MKRLLRYVIIIVCVIVTILLYNVGKGAIPLLVISAYFFIIGFIELYKLKNNKSN